VLSSNLGPQEQNVKLRLSPGRPKKRGEKVASGAGETEPTRTLLKSKKKNHLIQVRW